MRRLVLLAIAAASMLVASGAAGADAGPSCPSYNAPNTLTLTSGTPQSARLATPFDSQLAVTLANTNGCPLTTPLAGIPVTFEAPSSGPSGTFASSGSHAVLVGTNGQGTAMAPAFTANSLPGGYLVTASSDYGSVVFSLVNTASGVSASIKATGGSGQSAGVGARYGAPLEVVVKDGTGAPVGGATVTFSLGQGSGPSDGGSGGNGGTGTAGATFAGGETQATAVTDANGHASSPGLTANTVAGHFTASATTQGVVSPALFSLDNKAGKGLSLRMHGAARQSATVGDRYRHPLEAVVRNAAGRPVQGTTVTFSLGQSSAGGDGGGSGGNGGTGTAGASFVGGSSQATAVTDAHGLAVSPLFTADSTSGSFTATASATGVIQPVVYTLENQAEKGLSLRKHGVATQSVTVGDSYPRPLEAVLRNAAGRPVQGTTVTFTLGSGAGGGGGGNGSQGTAAAGASFIGGSSQATAVTDAHGLAVSPLFTADSTSGSFTATASVTSVMRPVTYTLHNRPGRSASLVAYHDPPAKATVDGRFASPLRARILDGSGHPIVGATVTFALGGGGGGGGGGSNSAGTAGATFAGGSAQAAAVTNDHGIAVSPALTANTVAGSYAATATSTAAPGTITFPLRNLPGKPATITVGAATGETATVGSSFPVRPAVVVADAKGNPVSGAVVTFTAPVHGASGSFGGHGHTVRVKTNSAGIAVAPTFSANAIVGGYAVRAIVRGARPAGFALTNLPRG